MQFKIDITLEADSEEEFSVHLEMLTRLLKSVLSRGSQIAPAGPWAGGIQDVGYFTADVRL